MADIYFKLLEINGNSKELCLATVTATSGSTPQKPGSSAIFEKGVLIAGTVGGGIVEEKTREASILCSETGKSCLVSFDLDNEISDKKEAICGGTIEILINANPLIHRSVFGDMMKSVANRETGILITMVTDFNAGQVLVNRYWMTEKKIPELPQEILDEIVPEAMLMISSGEQNKFESVRVSIAGEEPSPVCFLEKISPRPRLVIAGAGHVGKALSEIGSFAGFEVTVIDDRKDYANASNLPFADRIIVKNIGTAISEINAGKGTYIVIVTRGHSNDAEALKPAIRSGAAYVGMIGSRMKVARMKAEFLKNKWATEEEWARIHSPVGLEINSKTVGEIAISIVAELIQVKNKDKR